MTATTYLEEEVCKDGVEEDGPEHPSASAEKAGEESDDDSVLGRGGDGSGEGMRRSMREEEPGKPAALQ